MRTEDALWLAADAHCVAVDTDLVFLSVGRDAYFCLPDAAAEITRTADGALRIGNRQLSGDLYAAGLVTRRPTPRKSAPPPMRPNSSAIPQTLPMPTWRDLAPVVRAVTDIAITYHGQPLAKLLARAQRPHDAPPAASPELLQQVSDFHRWNPYAPLSGKCLLRSYMLLRHLRRVGLDAVWVFGVRIWPFYAHCWLQCDAVVLDDYADRVAAFTPILTV